MSKKGFITIGVILSVGVGVYFYYRIKRDKFKKKCIEQGGTLRGDWECNYENEV